MLQLVGIRTRAQAGSGSGPSRNLLLMRRTISSSCLTISRPNAALDINMARETSASKSYKPGMPIVFGDGKQPETTKNDDVSKKNTQRTLANWLESSWTPGMPVKIQQDGTKKRVEAPTSRSSTSSQSSIETYLGTSKAGPSKAKGKQPVKKTRRDATPPSSPDMLVPTKSKQKQQQHYIIDSSFSAAEQGCSANATFDPDSSIEFIEHHKSGRRDKRREEEDPLSSALKHATLAQTRLLEAVARRNEAEELEAASRRLSTSSSDESLPDITSRSGRKILTSIGSRSYSNQIASPYRNAPLDFLKASTSALPLQARTFSSTSTTRAGNENRPAHDGLIDWDDPVITTPLEIVQEVDISDSSDLPDPVWPSKSSKAGPLGAVQPTKSTNYKARPSSKNHPVEMYQPAKSIKKLSSTTTAAAATSKPGISKAEQERLRKAGREAVRQKREERQAEREEEVEKWKSSLREFSYDDGNWIVPKIWYFKSASKGLLEEKSELVSVEGLKGQPMPEPKSLEEVLESLEGPLGFDMEWEAYGRFNNFKTQGRTSLIQVGDAKNIVLYQVGQSSYLPSALVKIIEDPDIVKLGVHIGGDARKLFRDFNPKQSIVMKGLMDLSNLAKAIYTTKWEGYHHLIGLQKLVALYLDRYLDKGDTRTSNWSKDLNKAQRRYAANDVFCSVLLYLRLVGTAEVEGVPLDFAALIGDMTMSSKGEIQSQSRLRPVRKSGKSAEGQVEGMEGADKPARRRASTPRTGATPRQKEAWEHWHVEEKEINAIALEMNIKEATVAGYIVEALWAERDLPFSTERLEKFNDDLVYRKDRRSQLDQLLGKPPRIYPDLASLAATDGSIAATDGSILDNQQNGSESGDSAVRAG